MIPVFSERRRGYSDVKPLLDAYLADAYLAAVRDKLGPSLSAVCDHGIILFDPREMALATEYLQDMETSLGRMSWNAVVRRAQEVVELALKSVLSYLGVDYPKVHDPAAVFVATLAARGRGLSRTEAADVTATSARLARKRAPAFYFEHIEDEPAAREAAEDARRIHRFCARLVACMEPERPKGDSPIE